ncbi:MAG: nucleotide pyrophosphohydrolase [Candidatus Lokiarchaeota archaeon]|nr:nucleotide pyrophosphohydrolase [Candidatus Lokiarchaeota archaeon]
MVEMRSNKISDKENKTILFFKNEVKKFVQKRGWTKYHTPKHLIDALFVEVGELAELFLFREDLNDINKVKDDKDLYSKISDEVADIFIYLLSFVNCIDLDLTQAFKRKMQKNIKKYPVEEFNNGHYYKK